MQGRPNLINVHKDDLVWCLQVDLVELAVDERCNALDDINTVQCVVVAIGETDGVLKYGVDSGQHREWLKIEICAVGARLQHLHCICLGPTALFRPPQS